MTKIVSDDGLEAALRSWAQACIDEIQEPRTLLPAPNPVTSRQWSARRLTAVLAAAAVVLGLAALWSLRQRTANPAAVVSPPPCPTRWVTPVDTFRQLPGTPTRGPIFARPVAAMTACSYSHSRRTYGQLTADVPLSHSIALELSQHLNHAPATHHDDLDCLALVNFSLLVARDENGHIVLPYVTLAPGCLTIPAIGTGVRYLPANDPALRAVETQVAAARKHPQPTHT